MSNFEKELKARRIKLFRAMTGADGLKGSNIGALFEPDLSDAPRFISLLRDMKYEYYIEKTKIIFTTFKAERDGTSAIYATLCSRIGPIGGHSTIDQSNWADYCPSGTYSDQWADLEAYGGQDGPPIEHLYFTVGGNLISQDGEYRRRFQKFNKIEIMKSAYGEIFDYLDEYFVSKLEAEELGLFCDIFIPKGLEGATEAFEAAIFNSRLALTLFVMAWLVDFNRIKSGYIENHIGPNYQHVIYDVADNEAFEHVFGLVGGTMDTYIKLIDNIDVARDQILGYVPYTLEIGQKIIPLTMREMAEPHNINLDIWKELFIFANCSNLVLNLICPSFPFINNWFFIENIHAGLFDNVAQYDRFNNSEIAKKISKELKAIDKLNYHPFADSRNKRPLNLEFMGLSGRISGALAYSESNIVMSGAAIAITMEYVGRTLKDVPLLALNPLNEKVVWLQKFLSDVNSFSKYMFDYIYGFYCMNVKLGILHGDLHLNNATIYYKALGSYTDLPGDPHIAYVLNDDEAYLFPHMGTYGCLIDFSRSIIGDKALLLTEYTEDYAGQYLENQREQLWAFLAKYFPKFTENNKDRLMGRLQDNYFAIFKVATGVDSYSVAQNLLTFVSDLETNTPNQAINGPKKGLKIAPEIKKFIIRARDMAESIVIKGLEKLIEDPLAREDGLEWPNLELIRGLFGRFRAPKEIKDKRIVNIYNFKNEIKYKIQSYDLWPPLLKLESEIELAKSRSDGAKVAERLEKNIEAIRSDEADEVRKVVSEFVRSLAQ